MLFRSTVLEKHRAILETDHIIKVKGKLDRKEDQVKIIANEVEDIKGDIIKGTGRKKTENTGIEDIETINDPDDDGGFNGEEPGESYDAVGYPVKDKHDFIVSETEKLQENGSLVIILDKKSLDKKSVYELYEIIRGNPGEITVELKISGGNDNSIEKQYKLAVDYRVSCAGPFFTQLKSRFGNNVKWDIIHDIN